MKKIIFGLGIFMGGMMGVSAMFISVAIGGIYTSFLPSIAYNGFTIPFIICILFIIIGLNISIKNTFND